MLSVQSIMEGISWVQDPLSTVFPLEKRLGWYKHMIWEPKRLQQIDI